jgi:hypothetical protein
MWENLRFLAVWAGNAAQFAAQAILRWRASALFVLDPDSGITGGVSTVAMNL